MYIFVVFLSVVCLSSDFHALTTFVMNRCIYVLKLFINFCFQGLLKTATDCSQTERQIQQDAWGSAHTHVVQQ